MTRTLAISAVALLLFLSGPAPGDYYDPPEGWSDNDYFTHQQWEFSTSDNPVNADAGYTNPNGTPTAQISGDAFWIYDPSAYVTTDRRGMWVVGGFDNPTSASLTLDIPNDPVLPEKLVWLQITYFLTGAPGAAYDTDLVTDGGETVTVIDGSEIAYDVPGETGWFYYEKMWSIEPQPEDETITASIDLPAMAVFAMDEAVVDTICIPEPASALLLLAAGVAGLLRTRPAK